MPSSTRGTVENFLLARTCARPTAILHFLLSQPSHSLRSSALIFPWYQGIIPLNLQRFSKKLRRFWRNLPRFLKYLRELWTTLRFSLFLPLIHTSSQLSRFRFFPLIFLDFLSFSHDFLNECKWIVYISLSSSVLQWQVWRLWKQKPLFCRVRACTHARETLISHLLIRRFCRQIFLVSIIISMYENKGEYPKRVCKEDARQKLTMLIKDSRNLYLSDNQ